MNDTSSYSVGAWITPLVLLLICSFPATSQTSTNNALRVCSSLLDQRSIATSAMDWKNVVKLSGRFIDECSDVVDAETIGEAYGDQGEGYLQIGEAGFALRAADKCIEVFYPSVICHKSRYESLMQLGRSDAAKESYFILINILEKLIPSIKNDISMTKDRLAKRLLNSRLKYYLTLDAKLRKSPPIISQ